MKLCNRGEVNKWAFSVVITESFFLCSLTSRQTDNQVNFISDPINTQTAGNNLYIYFTEIGTGTVDAINGITALSPDGEWDMNIYEQASSTNLDPNAVGVTFLQEETVRVDSGVTASVAFTGTCEGSGGDGITATGIDSTTIPGDVAIVSI